MIIFSTSFPPSLLKVQFDTVIFNLELLSTVSGIHLTICSIYSSSVLCKFLILELVMLNLNLVHMVKT